MKKLLEKIGEIFKSIFNSAAKVFRKLPTEIKDAAVYASGVVSIINQYAGKLLPDEMVKKIQEKFPTLPLDKLKNGLQKIATDAELVANGSDNSLDTLIEVISSHLNSKDGAFWAAESKKIATLLGVIFSPDGTAFEKVSSIISYVYHEFIK